MVSIYAQMAGSNWLAGPALGQVPARQQDREATKPYIYFACCVGLDQQVDRLHAMIDAAMDITYRTFFRHVSLREAAELLGYPLYGQQGLTLKQDYHVSYHRSRWGQQRCYYLRHSAIEYIFLRSS